MAAAKAANARAAAPTQRCAAGSRKSLMVYVLAGHSASVALDFVLGVGWRCSHGKGQALNETATKTLKDKIEQAFLEAPLSALVALVEDPIKHFEYADLLCVHTYVMEHRLYQWICSQNHEHGLAPPRQQIMAHALTCIAREAPGQVQTRLCKLLAGGPRKQRKWLARFRRRWGARIGVLRQGDFVPVAVRKEKAGGVFSSHLAGPFLGPQYERVCYLNMNARDHFRGRRVAPKMGPQN